MKNINLPVILIGPMAAGKSTLGSLLARELGVSHIELDEHRWDYYHEIGYNEDTASRLAADGGFQALYRYWKPFEIHAVQRILEDFPDEVISFGAGHSVYEDESLFERAQALLAPYANIILVLPSPDLKESAAVLKERFTAQVREDGIEPTPEMLVMIEHFLNHPSNRRLAHQIIYTFNKSPEQSCKEILRVLDS